MKNKKIIIFITIFFGVFVLGCFTNFSMAYNIETTIEEIKKDYKNDDDAFNAYLKYLKGESKDKLRAKAEKESKDAGQDLAVKEKEFNKGNLTETSKKELVKDQEGYLRTNFDLDLRGYASEYFYKLALDTQSNSDKAEEEISGKSAAEAYSEFIKKVEEVEKKINGKDTGSMSTNELSKFKEEIDKEMVNLQTKLKAIKGMDDATDAQKKTLEDKYTNLNNLYVSKVENKYIESSQSGEILYKAPVRNDTGRQSAENIDDVINDGKSILKHTSKISNDDIKNFSNSIFNIFLIIGVAVATLVGAILGVKFMTSSVEGKADVKKMLIVYAIGCVAVFGAFTIWKIVVTILQGI